MLQQRGFMVHRFIGKLRAIASRVSRRFTSTSADGADPGQSNRHRGQARAWKWEMRRGQCKGSFLRGNTVPFLSSIVLRSTSAFCTGRLLCPDMLWLAAGWRLLWPTRYFPEALASPRRSF